MEKYTKHPASPEKSFKKVIVNIDFALKFNKNTLR